MRCTGALRFRAAEALLELLVLVGRWATRFSGGSHQTSTYTSRLRCSIMLSGGDDDVAAAFGFWCWCLYPSSGSQLVEPASLEQQRSSYTWNIGNISSISISSSIDCRQRDLPEVVQQCWYDSGSGQWYRGYRWLADTHMHSVCLHKEKCCAVQCQSVRVCRKRERQQWNRHLPTSPIVRVRPRSPLSLYTQRSLSSSRKVASWPSGAR
mgnify:CR=1 FL=1